MAGGTEEETAQDVVRHHVAALVEHAQSALWPERRAALKSLRRGIAATDRATLALALKGLGVEAPDGADAAEEAETFFRIVLTVYLSEVDDGPVTNPDQAALYAMSLDEDHMARAEAWYRAHPEHRPPT